jgi:hypothetical protein
VYGVLAHFLVCLVIEAQAAITAVPALDVLAVINHLVDVGWSVLC